MRGEGARLEAELVHLQRVAVEVQVALEAAEGAVELLLGPI
jgi:hypothetical protein